MRMTTINDQLDYNRVTSLLNQPQIREKGSCKPHTYMFCAINGGESTKTVTNEHNNRSP